MTLAMQKPLALKPLVLTPIALVWAAAINLGLPLLAGAEIPTLTSHLSDQRDLQLSLYQTDLALIKDVRQLNLPSGTSDVQFEGVSGLLRPETAMLLAPAKTSVRLLEQNFYFDLLTPNSLLEKSIGSTATLITPTTAEVPGKRLAATILSTEQGLVAEIDGKIVANPQGEWQFDQIPAGLRAKPTLVSRLNPSAATQGLFELRYLTGGLHWQTDYVAQLAGDSLQLAAWVSLTNQSHTDYRNARIQLIAGDVNRVPQSGRHLEKTFAMADMASHDVSAENLGDYKLYSLPERTDLLNRQTKQVALFSRDGVRVTQRYRFQAEPVMFSESRQTQKQAAALFLELVNTPEAGLGLPLPRGTIRVYQSDNQGGSQFLGEDRLDHTAIKDTVSLRLGNSFDVGMVREQTQYRWIDKERRDAEISYRLVISNAKAETVEVDVEEQFAGDWQITQNSDPHKKMNSQSAKWTLKIPAEGKKTLTFSVLLRQP